MLAMAKHEYSYSVYTVGVVTLTSLHGRVDVLEYHVPVLVLTLSTNAMS